MWAKTSTNCLQNISIDIKNIHYRESCKQNISEYLKYVHRDVKMTSVFVSICLNIIFKKCQGRI